jgi:hypothetical protein
MPNTLLTDVAEAKLAAAAGTGASVAISHIALGDGGGANYAPDYSQTALRRELAREAIQTRQLVEANAWRVKAEFDQNTPAFVVREIGFFDADGDLIALWAGLDVDGRQTGAISYLVDHVLSFSRVDDGLIYVDAPDDELLKVGSRGLSVLAYGIFPGAGIGAGASNAAALAELVALADAQKRNIFWPAGEYEFTNIVHGKTSWIGEGKLNTNILASPVEEGVDEDYLIASPTWLVAGSEWPSDPAGFEGLTIDALGRRKWTYAMRTFQTPIDHCRIRGGTEADLLVSTPARDGTLSAGTMVENLFSNCTIGQTGGSSKKNLHILDPNGKATDYNLLDTWLCGASEVNGDIATAAGWNIQGLHVYEGPVSLKLRNPSLGTRMVDSFFESKLDISGGGADFSPIVYGPGNFFQAPVLVSFENNGLSMDQVVMLGNTYGRQSQLRHNWFGQTKRLVSKGEAFRPDVPFAFYSGGVQANSSTGVIELDGATILGQAGGISTTFSGPGSSVGGVAPMPSAFAEHKYRTVGSVGWHHDGGRVSNSDKHLSVLASPEEALNGVVKIPVFTTMVGGDHAFLVDVYVAQREFHTGPQRTKFHRKYAVVKKSSTGTYHTTLFNETYDAAEWTVAPELVISDVGDMTEITFTGTVATDDGYGPFVMQVSGVH